ncbi:hypothetical protein [Erythrobacter sp. MTPC3]|uniref:hypothetical protein n=1 Tax=Erythrobacter sp. MTPC3 TaxID=3056564 RepID=UPI0036F3A1C0
MSLFSPDLYRNFAIGFLGGAFLLGAANADVVSDALSPPANAAAAFEMPQPANDFWTIAQ